MTNEEARLLLTNSCVMAGYLLSLANAPNILLLNEEERAFAGLARTLLGDDSTIGQLLNLAKELGYEDIVVLKIEPASFGATAEDLGVPRLRGALTGMRLSAMIQQISAMSSDLAREVQPLADAIPASILAHEAFKPRKE